MIDSSTVAIALALVCIASAAACNSGADIDTAATDASRRAQTVAMLGRLDQIHRVTRLPTFAPKVARNLPIKPVVSFRESVWSVEARPLTGRSGIRKVQTAARPELATSNKTGDIVMYVQREQDASQLADELAATDPAANITLCEMHPFAGVPAGAGLWESRG